MIDFITIVFNDPKEVLLLQIQAKSFYLVDKNIINDIYVIFNDNKEYFNLFKETFNNQLVKLYPDYLISKVKLIHISDLGLNLKKTTWFSQQIIKIYISKFINSKYYIVLDSKNHFKENISYGDFFKNEKPIIRMSAHSHEMLKYYYNCLDYFNVSCPNIIPQNNIKIQTITPFIFIKNICLQLINYIEFKENISFSDFININKKYTEFFLYYAFMLYLNIENEYIYINERNVITIGGLDPKIHSFNAWPDKNKYLNKSTIKIVALHRKCIQFIDEEYKNNILNFYKDHYKNDELTDLLYKFLY
jgi:hypothetical protein